MSHNDSTQLPPQDEKAEARALGNILIAAELQTQQAHDWLRRLGADHFTTPRHRAVRLAIAETLATHGAAPIGAVTAALPKQDFANGSALHFLAELQDCAAGIEADFNDAADRLELVQQRRQLFHAAQRALCVATDQFMSADAVEASFHKLGETISAARHGRKRRLLTFLSAQDVREWKAPEDLYLVGRGLITRGEVILIGGAPGIGKSRAALALAASGVTGRDWFGMPVPRPFRTLIIQCENGRHRLKADFDAIAASGIDPGADVSVTDCPEVGLAFARPDFREEVRDEIARLKPGVVIIDPWTEATQGDKKEDYQAALANIRSCLPKGDDAPALLIVCHTRKPQGEERYSGRGLLHLIAGSYTIGSAARTAFVIQKASDDPDDSRRVWTCCKANNCEMPHPSAWTCDVAEFRPVQDFDWSAWQAGGKPGRPEKVSAEDIRKAFDNGRSKMTRKYLADALQESCGCASSKAYDAIKRHAALFTEDENHLLSLR